ncbi:hypothetical protein H2198_007021 [Neophaeococcomyces mojaviensis]|uniref:Uncharacterized protein n=1 Tax=Neophaeococcomyces mojaviensis TaxID=3383035 RepID=A0ACC3A1A5_9EURO|nr:hypothetical protein H2198_007021 [Knufia sp. JES_112]
MLTFTLAFLAGLWALTAAEPCDPSSQTCTDSIPALNTDLVCDFTKQSSLSNDFILADYANISFSSSNGANFSFIKRYDAPYIWTNKYFLFGRVDVEVQAAPGTGLATGCVLMSDNKDEIDFEWSGNDFGQNTGLVQTNYFGKGITGNYDRGTQEAVSSPQSNFHTYSFDWSKDRITWEIDGKVVRTLQNTNQIGAYQFPQTPSRLHLGIWNAGDQDSPQGVVNWAGGYLPLNRTYSAFIKSVKIHPYMPCSSWQYPGNFTGNWQDVKCTNQTVVNSTISSGSTYLNTTNTMASSPSSSSAPSTYVIKTGDTCDNIAQTMGCSRSALQAANPQVNCQMLTPGKTVMSPASSSSSGGSGGSTVPSTSSPGGYNLQATVTATTTVTVTVAAGSVCPNPTTVTTAASGSTCPSAPTVTSIASGSVCPAATTITTALSTVTTGATTVTVTGHCDSATHPEGHSTSISPASGPVSPALDILPSDMTTSAPTSGTSVAPLGTTSSFATTTVTSTISNGSVLVITSYTPVTAGSTVSPVTSSSVITTISTITTSSLCTVCNSYTISGSVTSSCHQTMNTTVMATPVTATVPATSNVPNSTSNGPAITLPTGSTFVAPQSSSSMTTSSSVTSSSVPTTPFVTTATVPCSSCIGGTTTVTSTCSTYTAMTTVTVPCSSCNDGSTTMTSTMTMTLNSTVPPTYPNTTSTSNTFTVNATTPSTTQPTSRTDTSTSSTTTTTCAGGTMSSSCSSIVTIANTCSGSVSSMCSPSMTEVCGPGTCVPMTSSSTSVSSTPTTSSSTPPPSSCPYGTCMPTTVTSTTCQSTLNGTSVATPACVTSTYATQTCGATICLTSPVTYPPTYTTPTSSTTTPPPSTTSSASSCTGDSTCSTYTTSFNSCTAMGGGESSSCSSVTLLTSTCGNTICITNSSPYPYTSTGVSSTSTSPPRTSSTTTASLGSTSTPTPTPPHSTPGTLTITSTSSSLTTTYTVPATCTPTDGCFGQMLSEDHIDDAHNAAYGFCSDSKAQAPSWLTGCGGDRARMTSAFQCLTVSATPVPSAEASGKSCYKNPGGGLIYGKKGRGRRSRRSEGSQGAGEQRNPARFRNFGKGGNNN